MAERDQGYRRCVHAASVAPGASRGPRGRNRRYRWIRAPGRVASITLRDSAGLNSDSLVHRYAITGHDGIAGGEGTFGLCSFGYAEALTRAGRVREARMIFEKMGTGTANEPASLATAPRAMEKLEHVLREGVTRWL